jgi:hypothetical protein
MTRLASTWHDTLPAGRMHRVGDALPILKRGGHRASFPKVQPKRWGCPTAVREGGGAPSETAGQIQIEPEARPFS